MKELKNEGASAPFFMTHLEDYNQTNHFGLENNLVLKVISAGHIEYTMQLEQKHMATPNVVHGGAIAGLMDAVLSVAAFSALTGENLHVATVEFKINYLKAVRKPEKIRGEGKVIKKGNTLLFVEGLIYNELDQTIATATGTIMQLK